MDAVETPAYARFKTAARYVADNFSLTTILNQAVSTGPDVTGFTSRTHDRTRVQAAADIQRYREQKVMIPSVDRFTYGFASVPRTKRREDAAHGSASAFTRSSSSLIDGKAFERKSSR